MGLGLGSLLPSDEVFTLRRLHLSYIPTAGVERGQVVLVASFAILVAAPLCFGIPLLSTDTVAGAFQRALGFMVAAAPCALSGALITTHHRPNLVAPPPPLPRGQDQRRSPYAGIPWTAQDAPLAPHCMTGLVGHIASCSWK